MVWKFVHIGIGTCGMEVCIGMGTCGMEVCVYWNGDMWYGSLCVLE